MNPENKDTEKKDILHPETGQPISKSQLKQYLKLKEKEKKDLEVFLMLTLQKKEKKEKEAKEKEPKDKVGGKETAKANHEDVDPTKYLENRLKYIHDQKDLGSNPYPHKFHVSITVPEFREKYSPITKKGEFLEDREESITGRIVTIRSAGANLIFYDIISDDTKLQVYCNAKYNNRINQIP